MRARRFIPIFALMVTLQVSLAPLSVVSLAAQIGGCGSFIFGAMVNCGETVLIRQPPLQGPATTADPIGSNPLPPSSPPTLSVATLVLGPNGQPCVTFVQEALPPLPNSLPPRAAILAVQLLQQFSLCPTATPPAALAANPAVLAEQFWQTIPLPVPKPAVPPGFAVTGKPAYLVTHGTTTPPAWSDATPLGQLTVTARGTYQVSWGDGAQSGPFVTEGLPYPDGTISHTYDNVGRVTLTVTEDWTATWTLGPASGTLQQLRTVGRIAGLPVEQIQAVITH